MITHTIIRTHMNTFMSIHMLMKAVIFIRIPTHIQIPIITMTTGTYTLKSIPARY